MTRDGERVYREKPAAGAIETALSRLDVRERSIARALHFRNAAETIWKGEKSFDLDGVRVEFTAPPKMDGNRVTFYVRAFIGRRELPVDNPYIFVNPPTMVPDGTWRKEPAERGEERDVQNFRESPDEALKAVLMDAVRGKARKLGWRG